MLLITHNGHFHYDEILATAILLKIYPDAKLVRTRDNKVIETGDIVYDVGQIYDPSTNRYDHHQKTFVDTFSSKFNIKLSAAGLIYKHFHEKLFEIFGFRKEDSIVFDDIVEKIYTEFFLPADAIDNGYDDVFGRIRARTVADVVSSFFSYEEAALSQEKEDVMFKTALNFVAQDLNNYLNSVLNDYAKSYENFYKILKNFSGDFFITEYGVSTSLLYELNEKLEKDLKYIIIKNNDNEFRIVTIPIERGKFKIKYPLHSEWRGLSNEALVKASNIENCIFVHASGFTGGNKTLDGALQMCKESLKYLENEK